jgi:hypothetical protein
LAAPVNVKIAFCPGTVVVIVTGGPPGTMVPVKSGTAAMSVKIALPTPVPCGSRKTLYVPAIGKVCALMVAVAPVRVVDTKVVPSGFFSDTTLLPGIVEPLTARSTR